MSTIQQVISNHLNKYDLDVRKSNDARYMDQKCTPDVVCFIADCILNTIGTGSHFVVKDIWDSFYFKKNTRAIFNKPWVDDERARSEYDKFIQQPLRMLAYAHVLEMGTRGRENEYWVNNIEILEYIAQRERSTFVFMLLYLEKVLSDSNILSKFNDFLSNPSDTSYETLKENFIRFTIGNTKINGEVEVRRIFPKILNILAVQYCTPGSEKGKISKGTFTFSDLMYNRVNWRDIYKEKTESRQEAIQTALSQEQQQQQEEYSAYLVQKAINLVKKIHSSSEVKDQWGNGAATQVHHIFPKGKFPIIAHYPENLILLTATQHFTKAHPHNNTQEVDIDYQETCLLAKADSIDKSLRIFGERYYRKASFVYVVNTGLSQQYNSDITFRDLKIAIHQHYNSQV